MDQAQNTRMALISELATIVPGFAPKPMDRKPAGEYLLVGGRNLNDGRLIHTEKDSYINYIDRLSFRNAIAQPAV